MSQTPSLLEATIIRQIGEVDQKIRDLNAERMALQRLLAKARLENDTLKDVTRKNSINRVLIENRVTESLSKRADPIHARELYSSAKGVIYNLNESSFRSILMRMKQRGLIEKAPRTGSWWRLPKKGLELFD